MLQLSIALLFALAGIVSLAVIGQALRRSWTAAGELRAALSACDAVEPVVVLRTHGIERRVIPAAVRFNPAPKTRRTASEPYVLPVAA